MTTLEATRTTLDACTKAGADFARAFFAWRGPIPLTPGVFESLCWKQFLRDSSRYPWESPLDISEDAYLTAEAKFVVYHSGAVAVAEASGLLMESEE
jgi:hypothetical protein